MLKIYINDLASYNSGYLIGKWISLPIEELDLDKQINEVLQEGSKTIGELTEEIFISDYKWDEISLFEIHEYEDIYKLNENLNLLSNLEKSQMKVLKFLLDYGIAQDIEDALSKVDDVQISENQSLEDVAYDLIHECYNLDDIPSIISNNIDYKSIANDLEIEGSYYVVDNDVFVYSY